MRKEAYITFSAGDSAKENKVIQPNNDADKKQLLIGLRQEQISLSNCVTALLLD